MPNRFPKAVVILSGGMDSTVLAYLVESMQFDLHLLSFNYGQKHSKELEYAKKTAADLGVRHDIFNLQQFGSLIPNSALTDSKVDVPEGHYADETMRVTVVPNRNAIMLAIAFGVAAAEGATIVAIGVHAGDHPIYADCREGFLQAFQDMEDESLLDTLSSPTVFSPFIHLTKSQIAAIGDALNVPFENTWSCYKGGKIHCGKCGTCVERKEAFRLAEVLDPTAYEA